MEPGSSKSTDVPFFNFFKKKKADKSQNREIFDFLNGDIEESKLKMIRGIMDLSELYAREIMIPRVDIVAIGRETSMKEAVTIASEAGHSRIPVYDKTIDQIVGILYVKDLLDFIIADKRKKFDLSRIVHKPLFIPETMPLDELLVDFKKKRQHLAIVVDEYGGIAGIVTMEDILEQIVGEINDEFDEQELPEIIAVSPGVYDVDSRTSISDLEEELSITLPAEEFDTIGGLVYDLFGRIPVKNDKTTYNNITFTIKDIEGTKINRILVVLPEKTVNGTS